MIQRLWVSIPPGTLFFPISYEFVLKVVPPGGTTLLKSPLKMLGCAAKLKPRCTELATDIK